MGALRTGKDDFRALWLGRQSLWKGDLNPLVAESSVYRLGDAACDSNRAIAGEQTQSEADAAGRSPGVALPWRCHSTGTARAANTGGNCGCWPHRPRAGSHRPLDAAHGGEEAFLLDSGASHLAGGESRLL